MKKAILITSIVLVVALLGAIIFFAVYQKDYSYEFETPDIIEVNSWTASDEGDLSKTKIFEGLTKHSSKGLLASIVDGDLVKKPEIEKVGLTNLNSSAKYLITLRYSDADGKVLKLNGKNFEDPRNSAIKEIRYKELKIELTENNKDVLLKIYVMSMSNSSQYSYVIEQFGDYSELYNYLSSFENL